MINIGVCSSVCDRKQAYVNICLVFTEYLSCGRHSIGPAKVHKNLFVDYVAIKLYSVKRMNHP